MKYKVEVSKKEKSFLEPIVEWKLNNLFRKGEDYEDSISFVIDSINKNYFYRSKYLTYDSVHSAIFSLNEDLDSKKFKDEEYRISFKEPQPINRFFRRTKRCRNLFCHDPKNLLLINHGSRREIFRTIFLHTDFGIFLSSKQEFTDLSIEIVDYYFFQLKFSYLSSIKLNFTHPPY